MQTAAGTHLQAASTQPFAATLAGRASIVIAASAFVALCAHVSVPLLFTPVPLTLQPFAVILMGLLLGPTAGFTTMALYLAEGAAGLPVFTPQGPPGLAHLLGPTGGYLFSYPLAAAVAGAIPRLARFLPSQFAHGCLAGLAASIVIFTFGVAWFGHWTHLGSSAAVHLALAPFLLGEAIKIAAAAGIFAAIRTRRTA